MTIKAFVEQYNENTRISEKKLKIARRGRRGAAAPSPESMAEIGPPSSLPLGRDENPVPDFSLSIPLGIESAKVANLEDPLLSSIDHGPKQLRRERRND